MPKPLIHHEPLTLSIPVGLNQGIHEALSPKFFQIVVDEMFLNSYSLSPSRITNYEIQKLVDKTREMIGSEEALDVFYDMKNGLERIIKAINNCV
jgi:hypothetical protein